MKRWRWKRIGRAAAMALLVVTVFVSGALSLGIGAGDVRRVRAFSDAVASWQSNPDYRNVCRQYIVLGSDAMATRALGMGADAWVMGFRRLPGLPEYLTAHATSAAHYEAFASGELAAYLHLSGEQGIADGVKMVEELTRRDAVSDDDIIAFLRGFKLPYPMASDAGAVAGVRRLLRDVSGPQPFEVRGDIVQRLRQMLSGDVEIMSRAQQKRIFEGLDAYVKAHDPQLWRTKQVNDFLGGVWAAGYGPIYVQAIEWMLRVRAAARVVFVLAIGLCAWIVIRRMRAQKATPHPRPDPS